MRALVILLLLGALASPQSDREFVNKIENYRIVLTSDWRPESYTDAVGRRKTEFVFQSRTEGRLTIAREKLTGSLGDKVRNDQNDMTMQFACISSSQETFDAGQLSGIRVAFYYVEDGHRVVGTYYYFRDRDSVWVLRFRGEPTSTGIKHEVTDKMARSFCSVCPLL